MTDELKKLLDEMSARADAATPGPWRCGDGHYQSRVADMLTTNIHADDKLKVDITVDEQNADFIAHARLDVPILLAVIRELIEQRNSGGIGGDSYTNGEIAHLDAELVKIVKGENE